MTLQSISKAKQIFHAYLPLIFIFIFPQSFTGVFLAMGYIVFSGYIYLDRIPKKMPEFTYEYYLINSMITLIIIALHINII